MAALSEAEIEQRRNASVKFGAERAVKQIQHGQALTGPAREAELAVYDEFENKGRYSLVLRNASRLQAACDLYWGAVQKAAEDGDLEALDRYIARFGWLSGSSLRAWQQVRQEQDAHSDDLILDAINSAKDE